MFLEGDYLVCPAGRIGEAEFRFNLGKVLRAEQREDEVAMVTPQKAPELLREFNVAWRELHEIVTLLSSEKLKAEREVEKRRATLVIDTIPGILAEKKLSSNEANREALVVLDEYYQTLRDTADQLDAVVDFLKGKLRSFENAFSSVKKILGEDPYNMLARQNPNLSGGGPRQQPTQARPAPKATPTPAPGEPQNTKLFGFFGKSRNT